MPGSVTCLCRRIELNQVERAAGAVDLIAFVAGAQAGAVDLIALDTGARIGAVLMPACSGAPGPAAGRPALGRYGARAGVPSCTRSSTGRGGTFDPVAMEAMPGGCPGVPGCARSNRGPAGSVGQVALEVDAPPGVVITAAWPAAPGPLSSRPSRSTRSRSRRMAGLVSCSCRCGPAGQHRAAGRTFAHVVIEAGAIDPVALAPACQSALGPDAGARHDRARCCGR